MTPNHREPPVILVVDDSQEIIDAYREIFERDSSNVPSEDLFAAPTRSGGKAKRTRWKILTASQGQEAVELVEKELAGGGAIQAVFLDVRMPPGIDGLETAKRIRKLDSDLQVVICTAYSDLPFENFIHQLGGGKHLYYLEKPFAADEVRQLAESLVRQWATRKELDRVFFRLIEASLTRFRKAIKAGQGQQGLFNCLLEINDLTGSGSSALVSRQRLDPMAFIAGTGLLDSAEALRKARLGRLPLTMVRMPGQQGAWQEVEYSLLLLSPTQSITQCHQAATLLTPFLEELPLGGNVDPAILVNPPEALELIGREATVSPPVPRGRASKGARLMDFHGLRSADPAMKGFFEQVRRVAASDVPVFITGETGTGKELVARALHAESNRAKNPFLSMNCANLTDSLMESQLFGHRKGAFTGAVKDQPGLLAMANGGTVFLDEVTEIPLNLQARLLRVLQEREFQPLGDTRLQSFDAQVLSASHKPLPQAVLEGTFREDLLYRIHVIPLELSPLRERGDDVELLFDLFLAQLYQQKLGSDPPPVEFSVLELIRGHTWPGNVRELLNVSSYVFSMASGPSITPAHLPRQLREGYVNRTQGQLSMGGGRDLSPVSGGKALESMGDFSVGRYSKSLDDKAIDAALILAKGNRSSAARALGISRMTLWRHMKKNNL